MKKRLIAMIAAGAMVASAGLAVSAYADDTVFLSGSHTLPGTYTGNSFLKDIR